MEAFSIILTIVIVLIFISFCSVCCRSYKRALEEPHDSTRRVYVTTTSLPPPYQTNATFTTMPQPMQQMTTSQPLHPAGLGWQTPQPYLQNDNPPSYDEVVTRATLPQEQQPGYYPKQPSQNPGF
ncbi:hypothetical protein QE152_g12587 [Popillia japonica]|uniref:Uncharacterized protein n=1 Tax=Popillia japonica TaxID=7064 RepID=A0AAW1LR99_POPJA